MNRPGGYPVPNAHKPIYMVKRRRRSMHSHVLGHVRNDQNKGGGAEPKFLSCLRSRLRDRDLTEPCGTLAEQPLLRAEDSAAGSSMGPLEPADLSEVQQSSHQALI